MLEPIVQGRIPHILFLRLQLPLSVMMMMFLAALTLDWVLRIRDLLYHPLRHALQRDPIHGASLSGLLKRLVELCLLSLPLESPYLGRLL